MIWVPERRRFVTVTHAVFDETYFPARTLQKRVEDFFGTLPATQDADAIHAFLRGDSFTRPSDPRSPFDDEDPYDSDSSLPGLLVESSDSEGENDDDDDDDCVVVNKSTTPELLQQEHDKARPLASTYFDEFELNPDLQESIYFRGSNDEDETSAEIIEKTSEPNASTTRSGRTYGTANTAKVHYKTGFDIHEGKEVDIKGYLSVANEDLDAGGVVSNAFLVRVMVKALKAYAKKKFDMRREAAKEIALFRNQKTVKEALETPQRKEWIETIRKEMQSLVGKRVFEIKKVPVGRKVIPLRLVLKIKLASDGTIDKYKARCVVAGFRQTPGLDYDPQGTYSPMTEPTTLRLILSIADELDLELDHLDIITAYLNAELPEKERFYCSPPAGFKVPPGYGLYVTKGLYGAHQSGAAWATTFRRFMKERALNSRKQAMRGACTLCAKKRTARSSTSTSNEESCLKRKRS